MLATDRRDLVEQAPLENFVRTAARTLREVLPHRACVRFRQRSIEILPHTPHRVGTGQSWHPVSHIATPFP
jgi:hypothetical protein